jgi:nucleoside-diphosphate kinase
MKTLLIIKPDGTQILDKIVAILAAHSIRLCAVKTKQIDTAKAEELYEEHREKYFFKGLVKYMTQAPCILLQIKGEETNIADAKKEIRAMINATTKLPDGLEHELIKEYSTTFDGIHVSDAQRSKKELSLFFKKEKPLLRNLDESEKREILELKISSKQAF